MEYGALIDSETWAFIARTQRYYDSDAVNLPMAEQRRNYDAMCREFFLGCPEGVRTQDIMADQVACRVYESGATDVTVIYFHGGGFVVGGLESHDDICAEICAGTGYRVVAVDYRLCPEHPHPAAFKDCRSAIKSAARRFGGAIVLAGDSAGGNLAAAVAHSLRASRRNAIGQVLIYPGLGGDRSRGSYVDHAEAPMLTTRDVLFYDEIRRNGGPAGRDSSFAPLSDRNFSGLPPTAIFVAECDPLSDDGRDYRDALAAAQVPVWFTVEKGLVHGYLRARSSVRRAKESFERIVATIAALGRGEAPA